MSNLIPTPIVDKNGVPSIRHKKPVAAPALRSFPAPNAQSPYLKAMNTGNPKGEDISLEDERANRNFLTKWLNKRRRQKATDELIGLLYKDGEFLIGGTTRESIAESLGKNLSIFEVELAANLAQLVTRDSVPSNAADRDRKEMVWSLTDSYRKNNDFKIRAFYAHSKWMEEHPGEVGKLRTTVQELIAHDLLENGGRDGVQHLEEYMAACMHPAYEESWMYFIYRKDYLQSVVRHPDQIDHIAAYIKGGQGFKEEGFEDFLSAATRHPDKTDDMIDYMQRLGVLDEDGFEQYVNAATPLADGTL